MMDWTEIVLVRYTREAINSDTAAGSVGGHIHGLYRGSHYRTASSLMQTLHALGMDADKFVSSFIFRLDCNKNSKLRQQLSSI